MSSFGPHASPYPRFSDEEMAHRRAALETELQRAGIDLAIVYGANRFGSAVQWLTGWPVTREALVILEAGERDVMFVQFYNHVPNARRMADRADVRWGGESTIASAIEEIRRRGRSTPRLGIIGPLPFRDYRAMVEETDVVDLGAAYTRLRLRKSAEELEWIRMAARLTDRAVEALAAGARPGLTERELAAIVERSYAGEGTTHVHFLVATPMSDPDGFVPRQWHPDRELRSGDALVCEISAAFWDHPGQLLRTFAIGEPPAPLYAELHDIASRTFDAVASRLKSGTTAHELVEAMGLIEDAGYTTCDDLVHGFVGGYLPPVLHSRSRVGPPPPEFTLEEGMTVVVQPNVITRDERAGVQTGELLLVTERGPERLHTFAPGLSVIG